MKLASFRADGADRLGIEHDGALVDLASFTECPADMIALIEAGDIARIAGDLTEADPAKLVRFDPDAVEWHPPVRRPCKLVCVALNNRSLDAIKVKAPTDHPAFFLKPFTALTGHNTAIRLKESFGFTHPEPELAVVIGRTLREATPEEALAAVFGYSIVNDVTCIGMRSEDSFTVRAYRTEADGTRVEDFGHTSYPGRYKASDTFAPLGPYITTADEVPDPAALTIRCHMGGKLVASDHTGNYVWSVANALSHISRTMTLLPGDVVAMGTAVGTESSDPDAPFLPGITRCNLSGFDSEISIEIGGLGTLTNTVSTT
ncbi:MAG: fumarylacetoacetate hydrolase family protein [Candidatus Andeanibacterium colombiense]|uniref:Fumarylacetoacetate hydrolase family protein n=1 Tax=Candidatus Andeanibacterium colombiense TaxID=3121345 RepID=A0AAJ5X940_9SPHN|nr:MAG: fumarylacetoacetate hydrolase family protein [Sphingomonadaceae bacterium]